MSTNGERVTRRGRYALDTVRFMEDIGVGWWGLVASLTMVVVTAGVSLGLRLGLHRDVIVATARAVGQLVLAGWALTLVLDETTSIIWAWLWVGAMVPFAAVSAMRREPRLPGLGWMTALGYLLGLGISLSTVFGFGVMPFEARTLVPVAGMVVGNSLRVVVVASTRLIDGILAGRHEIEAMLALGFGRRESVRRVVAEALRLSLRPQIETTRTVGMVFLPGLFTGLILAGVEPLDAAIAQAVLLFLILGSAALTGMVVVTLGVRRFLTSDLLLVLPEGSVD